MARFTDEFTELERVFERTPSYLSPDVHETEYEEFPVGAGNIQPAGFLQDGVIDDLDLFASTIRPPVVLGTLPTLPDTSYPAGALVFLTTDGKLYRNVSDVWTVEVDGADIADGSIEADKLVANSITAGQIAAGAIGTAELAAGAVIANVVNVGGTVTIDDDGITIEDGALTFLDDFGKSVLTGAGFGTTWLDYLVYGMYNAGLTAGFTVDQDIDTATLVGDADTEADYAASLSQQLPYWVVESTTGGGAVELATAPAGFTTGTVYPRAMLLHNADVRFFQDIPIHPGQDYSILLGWGYASALGTGSFTRTVGVQWRDSDHAGIDTMLETGLLFSPSAGSEQIAQEKVIDTTSIGPAPENARYLRVAVEFDRDGVLDTMVVVLTLVRAIAIRTIGDQIWANDSGTELMRLDAGGSVLEMTDANMGLRVRNFTNSTLGGDNHAITTGTDAGTNLAVDDVGIQARNNGAASNLNLNKDGGSVSIAENLSVNTSGTSVNISAAGNIVQAGGFIEQVERSDPAAPSANTSRLYTRDNGSGKTQLVVRFNSGAIQVLATQP